jgi:SOS response regulatory protein OraA/RecX
MSDLMRAGISMESARHASQDVYSENSAADAARDLAMKQAMRLKKLEPSAARRRLIGFLQRRGFDYEAIGPAVTAALGPEID